MVLLSHAALMVVKKLRGFGVLALTVEANGVFNPFPTL